MRGGRRSHFRGPALALSGKHAIVGAAVAGPGGMDDSLKLNNFDLLRILAATQVLLSHGTHHLGIDRPSWWPVIDAFPGVPVFFALSGFLISASYERSRDLGSYARNRFLRIYPGLWCCILLTVPVAWAFGADFVRPETLTWLFGQLVGLIYTPGFLRDFGFGSYNGSLWTIPIELQFYMVLPALYLVMRRLRHPDAFLVAVWVGLVAVAYVCRLLAAGAPLGQPEPFLLKLLRYTFLPHVFLFITGVLMQRFAIWRATCVAGKGLYWLAAYLAFHFLAPPSEATSLVGLILLGGVSISLAYTGVGLATRLLRGNDLSYGVYIYHGLLLNLFIELGLSGEWRWFSLLCLLTFVLAGLSWMLVERPFIRRKKQSLASAGPLMTATLPA
jgi:peptidoglycan/LPS O-acetylase OafA/YrhL